MKEKILSLRDKGYTFRAIAKELRCSSSTVYRYIHPKPLKVGGNVLKKELADKIRELAEQGVRPYEILQRLGVSYTSYQKYGKPYQVTKFTDIRERIISMRLNGKKISEVASELGISKSYIVKQCKGIKFRKRKEPVRKVLKKPVKETKVMKKIKKKEVKASPLAIDQRAMLGQGVEAGVYTKEVKMRDNRDEGRLVSFLYSDLTDTPSVRISIRVRDNATDKEAVDRWCKKHGKKSWRIVK